MATGGVAPITSQLFGVVLPGSAVRTDFLPDGTGQKFTLALSGLPPHVVSATADLVFFFLPGAVQAIPPGHGAMLYWQAASSATGDATGFELLGAITPDRPSGIFRTGWSTHEALVGMLSKMGMGMVITLGVSVETLGNIQNLQIASRGVEDRMDVAKKIAKDLFNYLQSFDDTGARSGYMTVPINVFDRWMTRFQGKLRMDPAFFMKSDDS
uniref:Hikeshi-like domain-containing protein n=1 Tax=Trieres chinensis TaxID=1514140 RepID=A0A7S1Z8Y4_TRICV|mmetsp:Transcript_19924/g.40357  ORF Transcript_19924/g.40357 Transcript_19924/m.40357 type:complete len:212 (+) Transcript_19924:232-867(+)|eukprot:CAMPEP_0183319416 /NCGR_PEP_ID=MMETSP0160_2-20130417/63593_1 /TAXON_ID=2839 ORGANISM="Odontella Sinensis, Strain Grunow 1884" /NCGR_SAMPLE_ID=MMETSP0160_2 /ASSEMBLY_ACC=CAM_ASM_000250 /LENGTH=211 /DNA_ID=CAMNT_0025485893 /DNA_START=220 /DNA_END=855 /DNA_ORIENTATION=-